MSLPFDQQKTQSGNSIFETIYVYDKLNGNVVGNVTGDLTGNVTGDLTGNVTGDATGLSGTPNLNVGIVTATSFNGDGSNLTNLPAGNLTGALPAIDGSALTGIVSIPAGVIVMWSGSIASIPSGWVICNGSNGTPDLRDRFIVGAGNNYSVGDTGGADSVTLTTDQIPSHSHVYTRTAAPSGGQDQAGSGSGDAVNQSNQNTTSTGGGQAHENRPPYYALAYIMKT